MTNLSSEKEYDDVTSWLSFCTSQILKSIYTCLPATISSYNSTTKRAVVNIALNLVKTDDSETAYPAVADIPIIFPSSSKYIVHVALEQGDPILVLFSQRGIANFKQTFSQSTPDIVGFFSLKDAVGIAGFGSLTTTPAASGGITIQSTDGQTFINLQDNAVQIKSTVVTIDGNMVVTGTVTADEVDTTILNIDGNVLPSDHRHGGVEGGSDETGTPI